MAIIAIVGRSNAGKSTLFNKIVGRRQAVVEKVAGTTRDRVYGVATFDGVEFEVVDTGGLDNSGVFEKDIALQVSAAIEEADLILLLLDKKSIQLQDDRKVLNKIQRSKKPYLVVVNKVDQLKSSVPEEFYRLGVKSIYPVSAAQGRGINELLQAAIKLLPHKIPAPPSSIEKVALIGRPNSGKSTLFNKLIGEERAIVSEVPGTTIDAISAEIEVSGNKVLLYDTAGVKRKVEKLQGIEYFGTLRSLEAVEKSDAVVMLIDTKEGPTVQDKQLAAFTKEAGVGLIIVLTKWDLSTEHANDYVNALKNEFRFVSYSLLLLVSAKEDFNVDKIPQAIGLVLSNRSRRIEQAELTRLINSAIARKPVLGVKKRVPKIKYAVQLKSRPIVFALYARDAAFIAPSYLRYIENRIREAFHFDGVPIKIITKEKVKEKRKKS